MLLRNSRFALFVGAGLLSSTSAFAQSPTAAASPDPAQPAAPSAATAAQPAPSGLEDIVVTAQRRSERLQDVPIAISAFTARDVETRQINSTLDLVNYVPNLIGHNNTALGTANTYSLRGLANTESISTFDPPVGTYINDIYISRQGANNFELFDVERVEVLRGPQGTLFGRNTTGGAISVVLRPPGESFGGYLDAAYGRYNRIQARGSVDVPLIAGRLLTKFSAYYVSADGYVHDRVTGELLNGEVSWGVRGALRAQLTDTVRWDLSADYVHASAANLPNFYDPTTGQRISFTPIRTDTPIGSSLVSPQLAHNSLGNTAETYLLTSNLQIEAGRATINVITGYLHLYQNYITESFAGLNSGSVVIQGVNFISGNPGTATPLVNDSWSRQFSQEIKITGNAFDGFMSYVGGLYYLRENNETNFANISIPLVGPAKVSADRIMYNDTTAYAGYFQGDFHLTRQLTFTAGMRYTDEDKTIAFTPNQSPLLRSSPVNQPFGTQDLINAGIPVEQHSRVWTPRFALQYAFTPSINVYASATRGFKSGGWNSRAYYATGAQAFTPETIWSFEGGLRSEFLDHRVRVNLTGFYYDDKDTQLPGGGFDPTTNTITYLTRNVADQRNYGLESEVSVIPVHNLNIFWSAGLQHASYHNINALTLAQQARCLGGTIVNNCNAGIITPTGGIAAPTRAPHFTSTVGANYTFELGSGLRLQPSINWNYVSGNWVSTSNDPRGFQPAHSIINAGITLRSVSGFSLGVECNNCFDKTYITSFLIYPYLNNPGSWMVRARYNF